MQLLTVIIAIAFLQVWGANNPLHKDAWFRGWIKRVEKSRFGLSASRFLSLLSVFGALLLFGLIILVLSYPGTGLNWLMLPISVVVLLYSFGRGEFGEIVSEYTKACYVEDWPSALERAQPLGVTTEDLSQNDWPALHERVLEEASYRGFERMFAVLFWFFLTGPLGALGYRLLFLYVQEKPSDALADRLLWAVEWPAARVLGLSFSFTGNFVGCYNRWRESLFCRKTGTRVVLGRMVFGALSIDEEITQTCEVTRKELNLVHRLYARSLWFWLGALGFISLIS